MTDQKTQGETQQREPLRSNDLLSAVRNMPSYPKITKAAETIQATEWFGDPRVNMTTLISAGRVLVQHIADLENESVGKDQQIERLKRQVHKLRQGNCAKCGGSGSWEITFDFTRDSWGDCPACHVLVLAHTQRWG